jgi:hypothetical protein
MRRINARVSADFGHDIIQCVLTPDVKQSVDFYIADEGTVIEVEFSLCNPYPCLEKDAFKVLLAKDVGHPITKLVLVGDPGCKKRLSAPAPKAIIAWLKRAHNLDVEVVELSVQ